MSRLRIAFFGSSLVSAYWNGAATYYRGIVRELAARGHKVTFYEPDVFDRQKHRDIEDPPWAKVVVYPPEEARLWQAMEDALDSDLLIKTSGIGIFDDLLEAAIPSAKGKHTVTAFWDVDAPATLARISAVTDDSFRSQIPRYDLILTYGGGQRVVDEYLKLGARECVAIYNALDSHTHFPVSADSRFSADIGFLGNRLPDREARVEEFFLRAAEAAPRLQFLFGGTGWNDKSLPSNVNYVGHVFTRDHNAFNCSVRAVLNVNRESMASYGFSPPTRLFEAAGAGACLISDAWLGIEMFLEPGREVLVARSGAEVAAIASELKADRAHAIGQAALKRILREHTYRHRVDLLEGVLAVRARAPRGSAVPLDSAEAASSTTRLS
jgi:spore maturation protein CgeB